MASRQLLLITKEATYADPALTPAALDTIYAEGVAPKILADRVVADPAKPTLGGIPGYVTGEHFEVAFDVQLAPSGVAGTAPKWGKLMKACGCAEVVLANTSVAYNLVSDPSASDSMSIIWRDAGRLHRIRGARGKWGLKLTSGQLPKLSFVFRGLYQEVEAGAPLVAADANFTGWNDAVILNQANTTFTFDGVTLGLRDLSVDSADNVKFFDLPNQKGVQLLGDRAFTGTLKATTPPIGTLNLETRWHTNARPAFSLILGATAGKIVTLIGRGQFTDPPSYSREDEQDVVSGGFQLLGSSFSTDDDIALTLT